MSAKKKLKIAKKKRLDLKELNKSKYYDESGIKRLKT